MHTPFVITKEVDSSSVALHQLQASNEILKEWELQFWTAQLKAGSGSGAEVQNFTIRLSNASIASIAMQMPNNKHPDLTRFETFEEVSFSYEKIECGHGRTAP